MATPAQKGAANAIMYGLAIMQAAASRGSKAAAEGVQRAVQLINSAPDLPSVPTPVELGGSLVRGVGDLMLPPTFSSPKSAPVPAFGAGAKQPAKSFREVVDTSSRPIPQARQAITPPARPAQPRRSAASEAPAPGPTFGDRGAARATVMPTAPGPRPTNIPGVPGSYFEGSVFRSGVPDPWTTAPIQSRLEPFNFPEAAASSPSVQALLSPGFEALQGTQMALPLRQRAGAKALVDYVTSKGATRPAGTRIGGQAFSQAPFNVPESAREVLRGAGGRPLVPLPEGAEYAEAAFGPGQSIQAQLASWGLDPAQVDNIIAQYSPSRNAMEGVAVQSIPSVVSPSVAAEVAEAGTAAGRRLPLGPIAGAATLGGLGIGAFMRGYQNQIPGAVDALGAGGPPGRTPLGDTTANIDTGANTPAVTGDPLVQPAGSLDAANAIPGTVNPSSVDLSAAPPAPILPPPEDLIPQAAGRPVVSAAGAGSVTQRVNSGDSEYRQAAQNAAQGRRPDVAESANIADFYRKQATFANAPGRAEEIIGALKGMGAPASVGIESEANFETWARSNPELAYRLQLQMQRRGPSQQMPTAQGAVLGTSMGTNTSNNAAGQARAAAINAAFGTQGSADLNATLAPQAYQTLEKMPMF